MELEFTTRVFWGTIEVVDGCIVDDSVVEFMVVEVDVVFAVVVEAMVVIEDEVYVANNEVVALGLALQTAAEFSIITVINAMMAIFLGYM